MVTNESVQAENIRQIIYVIPEELENRKKLAYSQLLPEPIEGVTVEFVQTVDEKRHKKLLQLKSTEIAKIAR